MVINIILMRDLIELWGIHGYLPMLIEVEMTYMQMQKFSSHGDVSYTISKDI